MRPMKKGSSGLKIRPETGDPAKKYGGKVMAFSNTSALNPTKKFLIDSLSKAGREQRAADERRFSVIHDKNVSRRRKKWIQELEQKVIDTRAELRARTGAVGVGAAKFVLKKTSRPTALVGTVKVNTNFKIDSSGPFATNEAAEKLWEFVKNEKVKLYHTVPRTRNHSIRHTLEEAEAPARRITVVSPKERAKVMKRNAAKSLESRMKVDAISAMENTADEDVSMRESMMMDGKKQLATKDGYEEVKMYASKNKTREDNTLSIQKNILSESAVQSRDELYFYEVDIDRSRKKMDMQMSASEFKGMYGYKPTFPKLKSPKSDVRAMADNVLYDALPGSTKTTKSAPAAVENGSPGATKNVPVVPTYSGDHDLHIKENKVDAEEDDVTPQQSSPSGHLNVNADASIVTDNDADNMIYSSPLSSSYITRKTPTPPRTRPLSPPSNIKLANVMSDTLNEDLQYEIKTLKMNVRNDPTVVDGGSSHAKRGMENNLVENQEDADNVVIEGKGLENVVEDDDVDPLNASNISNDDPMNSSNVSFGTAALENAMASIIATNDAAYGISPLGNTRKGLPKDQSLEIDEGNLFDSLQQGKAVPLNPIKADDVRESEVSTLNVVDELRDIDESLSSPFRAKENNGTIMPVNNATLETLESEIWREHLELKKLGLL